MRRQTVAAITRETHLAGAFELSVLIPKVEGGKIVTLTSWEEKIYVGTDDGQILCYDVQEHENTGRYLFELVKKVNLNVGKRPVEQLLVIRDLGKLIARCDGVITVFNLFTLEISGSIPHKKGVLRVCLERQSQQYRVCLETRSRLSIYEYNGTFQLIKNISIPEPTLYLEWKTGIFCIAYKNEYVLLDSETEEVIPTFQIDSKPCAAVVADDFLLARDDLGIFVTDKGLPTRGNVVWSSTPDALEVRTPYVLALSQTHSWFEIHSILNQQLVQRLPFPERKEIKTMNAYEGSKFLLAATSSVIYMVNTRTVESQVISLLEQSKGEDAAQLVEYQLRQEKSEVAAKRYKTIFTTAGETMLKRASMEGAFLAFELADLDPRHVMNYFPAFFPGGTKDIQKILLDAVEGQKVEADKLYIRAKINLMGYLQQIKPSQRHSTTPKEINQVLVKLYLDPSVCPDNTLADQQIEHILDQNPDNYNATELEQLLRESGHYHATAVLLRNTKDLRGALDLWKRLGNGGIPGSKDTNDGVQPTVDLLASMDVSTSSLNKKLLWEYAAWVLQRDLNTGLKIFMSKSRPTPLDPKEVLDYLVTYGDLATEPFLEFSIFDMDDDSTERHNRLGLMYINTIKGIMSKGGYENLLNETREKFVRLIRESKHIKESSILLQIQTLPLLEEKLILLTRMKQLMKALALIVEELHDFERAEQFCHDHQSDDEGLTLSLLKVYMDLPKESQIIPPRAAALLKSHSKQLNPVQVLPLLPAEMPLVQVKDYLLSAIRHNHHLYRTSQITRGLCKSETMNTRFSKMKTTNKALLITRDVLCPVCQKPIGDKVFARYPNNTVVHFKCFKSQNVCPVTNTNFRKIK
ncbi:transforming growth factor-beta receptor-associated protein 1-like [Planoprotostelium fungivorum]|uniref:Transforming growth factor-beta receptor-associated protein 1-like n=1 Tax=Planoprotostelium fungivorum TaxID=1890364 RepID=A0A2P6N1Z2_9EUKA|nr:transforming growth factor-beta receptor-associated protein 1-like [Planoprotostelium fungivorum]